jgi:hypothetical protein
MVLGLLVCVAGGQELLEGVVTLKLRPVKQKEAFAFIAERHRHHKPPAGWLFGIGVESVELVHIEAGFEGHGGPVWHEGHLLVGVITVGRPVARMLDDGSTAEVNRCCTDGSKNACSLLYAAAWRAAKAMGYRRLITYTLPEEGGASLRGAGWKLIGERGGGKWSRPSRGRDDVHPTQQKLMWEAC